MGQRGNYILKSDEKLKADFIAEVTFRTAAEGGRSTPAHNGYRPQVKFHFSKFMTSGVQNFTGKEKIYPGEKEITEITILSPQLFEKQLSVKMPFELREGTRVVATGIILEIINEELRR